MTIALSMWQHGVKVGLVAAVTALLLSLIGMVEAFAQRDIVSEVVSMGHTLLLMVGVFFGYMAAKRTTRSGAGQALLNAAVSGIVVGASLLVLLLVGGVVNLRAVLINASPVLYSLIMMGFEGAEAVPVLLLFGALSGVFGGVLYILPGGARRVVISALSSVVSAGVLQDLLRPTLSAWGPMGELSDWLFSANGLSMAGSIALLVVVGGMVGIWAWKGTAVKAGVHRLPSGSQAALKVTSFALLLIVLFVLPQILGLFLSEVLTIVGLYVLLGLGLNIVVGYAGLLDLGYVAFFAIGSYTTAILTSPELGFFSFSFWGALPVAIILGVLSGVLLGVPVLKMRGDYLAIATLGFGEIIRILVLSDFLRPWLGGAQGVGKIPKASVAGFEFAGPQEIYYLILAGCFLVIFISLRLRDSRLGRAWMAMREDEDVAQAMGINLVATKLLAFATGAGFSALSGAIFASKLGSVYPHSFNVMISINIVCLIIVGGMGSIPGVIVGAAALVGLPELLREFAEYRLLVYGAALVVVMLVRPEGILPEAVHRREFHEEAAAETEPDPQAASAPIL